MKVADTSYIVEGLLRNKSLFESENFLTPELALYEIVNALWKHEKLLGDIENGLEYLEALDLLLEAGVITFVSCGKKVLARAYKISITQKVAVYDSVFVALAIESGMELSTLDRDQKKVLEMETSK